MMKDLDREKLNRFQLELMQSDDVLSVVANTIGGTTLAGGLWRFFDNNHPGPGIVEWNDPSTWKTHWGYLEANPLCIGEDVFGNQIICIPVTPDLLIWNHENGELFTLEMQLGEALEAVLEDGLDWIEFYADGSPSVGLAALSEVREDLHLHWTTPLILGGAIDIQNTSLVARVNHLIGHAHIWNQVRDLPPGTSVRIQS